MLRALLAVLRTDGPKSYTVTELAERLRGTEDEVRLALWQLERIGFAEAWHCASAAERDPACDRCPIQDGCAAPNRRPGALARM